MKAPLTKTEHVLAVLRAGGRIEAGERDGLSKLVDAEGGAVPAWQNAMRSAARIHAQGNAADMEGTR